MLRKRLFASIIAITFIFLFILGKSFYVTVIWGDKLQQKALDQWTRELPIKAKRGDIVDRNGVILAGSKGTYAIYIRNRCVKDAKMVAKTLSDNIEGVSYSTLLEKMAKKGTSEITVKRQVDKKVVDNLSKFNLEGVYYSIDNTRVYPYGSALCQTLGYTSVDGVGQSGLEKYYNEFLCGKNGEILYESDLVGNDVVDSIPKYIPATNGLNIKLTIDQEIQLICESEIKKALDKYNPISAEVIIMQPKTGKILALCQQPSYDLNAPPRDDMQKLLDYGRNHIITNSYEPGSTFKVITSSANIQEYLNGNKNAFSLTHIFSGGRYRYVGGKKIKCWSNHDNGKHSNENLSMALNNSCNPIFVDIALSLGKDVMYDYVTKFNFGSCTNVDFNGEAIGLVLPKGAVTDGDIARIGFGQTIAVTPIQLASAICACVNGGNYFQPYFVEQIYNDQRVIDTNYPTLKQRVISKQASDIIAKYLEDVVTNGSGKQAYIEGYKVGGKTGTAQKNQNGVILSGKYVMSFTGFFPADNPEYLALVIVDEPIGGQYGSTVCAPICKGIFEKIISAKNL